MKIEDLQARVARLHSLLRDPEPGCFTYHTAVHEQMEALIAAWNAPKPKEEGSPR